MRELLFEVIQEADGGYWAECLPETIVTEGDTWDELRQNVKEWSKPSILTSLTDFQPPCGCTWFEMKSSLTHEAAAGS